jgi:hypothetical protein
MLMHQEGYEYIGSEFHKADQRLVNNPSLALLADAVRELRSMENKERIKYSRLVREGEWDESTRQHVQYLERDSRRKWFAWVRCIRNRLLGLSGVDVNSH